MSDFISKSLSNAPMIMGVVNVTPDSFSDGGDFYDPECAISHGLQLLEEGAHILDIGGESTRPNADIVNVDEEIKRVVPVIEGLAGKAPFISIDTRNAQTMRAALNAGANIVNDVSGLLYDQESIEVVAESQVPVCIMHSQGTPQDMQDNPEYGDVVDDISAFFEERIETCSKRGIGQNRIIVDPGIGFGKTLEHNLKIIAQLERFQQFGCPVLLGVSRKSFIGKISGEDLAKNRLPGSLASALVGLEKGAHIFRVHDVKETKQAFDVYQAIYSAT